MSEFFLPTLAMDFRSVYGHRCRLKIYGRIFCIVFFCSSKSLRTVGWNMGKILILSLYTLSDLGVLSNLIGSLSLANEHYSPLTE